MKRLGWLATSLLALTLATATARAGSLADTVAVTPGFRAVALEIVRATGTDTLGTMMARFMSEQMVQQMRHDMPGLDDSTAAIVKEEYVSVFADSQPGFVMQIVQLYARHFNEAEMRDLLTFYRSPVGIKMVHEMPEIMRESVLVGQALGEHLAPIAVERVQKRLKAPAARSKS